MSTALLEAPLRLTLRDRRPTLVEALDATLRRAREDGEADCPICHAAMHAEPGADVAPGGGAAAGAGAARCSSCGTTLA
jgi:hypothetical protein